MSALLDMRTWARGLGTPDRALDFELERLTLTGDGWVPEEGPFRDPRWVRKEGDVTFVHGVARRYTTLTDTAIDLVRKLLPGWVIMNLCEWEHPQLRARGPWMAQLKGPGLDPMKPNPASCMGAKTPALALVVALLNALIFLEEAKNDVV